MSRAGVPLAIVVCLSAVGNPLGAQSVSMRVGGVHARYADSISATAGAIGLLGSWEAPSWRLGADASFARFASGGSATQGSLTGAWIRPLSGATAVGVQALGTGNVLSTGVTAWTGNAQLFAAATGGGWLAIGGFSAGTARTVWSTSYGVTGALLRLKREAGPFSFEADASRTWAGTLRYTDLTGGAEWSAAGAAARFGIVAGTRIGSLSGKPLIQAHGEWTLPLGGIVLEGAVGRYPEDLTGFTSGVFANLGLRVPLARRAHPVIPGVRGGEHRSVVVEPGDSGRMRITIELPNANSVAIGGEWNQWNPVPMTRIAANRWQVQLPLARGAWRFAVEVDGQSWVVPPGVPKMPDGFGGDVGVLVIG